MNEPTIAVLITCYNHAEYLEKCLLSVFQQTYKNIKVYIYDDLSTDESRDIINKHRDSFEKIFFSEEHRGTERVQEYQNMFLEEAEGDYYLRLDSDDYLKEDYIEAMVVEIQKDSSLDWVAGNTFVINEKEKVLTVWTYVMWPTNKRAMLKQGFDSCSVVLPHHGLMRLGFIRDNHIKWRTFDSGWGADVRYSLECAMCSPKIKYIDSSGWFWRIHGSNNSFDVKRRIALCADVKKYYSENIPDEYYLNHPIYKKAENENLKQSFKYYFLASNLLSLKYNFAIPYLFVGEHTEEDIKNNISLLDDNIRYFCDLCLHDDLNNEHKKQVEWILDQL